MPREVPPPLEMLCLRALWALGEASVSDVRRVVGASKPLAYTTVMTLLERLARKGTVSRRKVSRAFMYSPAVPRDAMRRLALRDFVECFFEGSEESLAEFLRAGRNGFSRTGANQNESLDTTLL